MFNKKYKNLLRQHEEAWTLSYLFPEKYGGAKIPDSHPSPSNTTMLVMDRTVKSYNGDYVGAFSPIVETCAPYFNSYEANTSLPTGGLGEYVVYADNNGAAMSIDGNNILANLSSWGYSQGPSYQKLGAYKRLRVVGACLELKVMDRERDYSGLIETCLGFEVIGNGLKNDKIDLDKLSNYPHYKTFKTTEEVILKYRYNNDKYTLYGPYEPFSTVPFHVIRISGLSASASVRIRTIIHVEGMLMPNLVHFATKDILIQRTKTDQQEKQRGNVNISIMSREDNDIHHQTYTGSDKPDSNLYTEDGFPISEKVRVRIKREDDLLQKRNDQKIQIDNLPETLDDFQQKSYLKKTSEPVIQFFGNVFSNMTATDVIDALSPTFQTSVLKPGDNSSTRALTQGSSRTKSKKKSDDIVYALPASETRQNILALEEDPDKQTKMVDGLGLNMGKVDNEPNTMSAQLVQAFMDENPGVLTKQEYEVYKHYEPTKLFEFKRAYDLAQKDTKQQLGKQNTATYNKYELTIQDEL